MQKRKAAAKNNFSRFVVHLAAGAAAGLTTAVGLFSILAAICCKVDIPPHLLLPISTAAACLSVLPAGIVFSVLQGEKGILYGLLTGILFFAILWIISVPLGQPEFTVLAAIKGVAIILSGAVGGYMGIALKERRRPVH